MKRAIAPAPPQIEAEIRKLRKLDSGLLASPRRKDATEIAINDRIKGAVWALEWTLGRYDSPSASAKSLRAFAARLTPAPARKRSP